MPDIGVRELKTRASEIVQHVRAARARYVVTYRGRPVGLLMPLDETPPPAPPEDGTAAWDELTRLGEAIGRG